MFSSQQTPRDETKSYNNEKAIIMPLINYARSHVPRKTSLNTILRVYKPGIRYGLYSEQELGFQRAVPWITGGKMKHCYKMLSTIYDTLEVCIAKAHLCLDLVAIVP